MNVEQRRAGDGKNLELGLGLTSLALHGARELTDMIAQMHVAIALGPFLPKSRPVPDPHWAPFPYRIVAGSFDLLARGATGLTRALSDEHEPDSAQGQFLRGVVNGVLGDKLAAWEHPLAIDMSLRDAQGDAVEPGLVGGNGKLLVFIHGLCLTEQEWMTPAEERFIESMREEGYHPVWLRYNSGLAIAENGRMFSDLLDEVVAAGATELVLVGHSMGGLLIRSAIHDAEQVCAGWLPALSHAAYLATPHHGSHWERLGHWVNTVGAWASVARPLARLGHIRSAGIRDLRHGVIRHEDRMELWDDSQQDSRKELPELPAHVRHLALAGSLPSERGAHWSGDGLVPLDSGLGHHRDEELQLRGEQLTRIELHPLEHLKMLADQRVYAVLHEWILDHDRPRAELPAPGAKQD